MGRELVRKQTKHFDYEHDGIDQRKTRHIQLQRLDMACFSDYFRFPVPRGWYGRALPCWLGAFHVLGQLQNIDEIYKLLLGNGVVVNAECRKTDPCLFLGAAAFSGR